MIDNFAAGFVTGYFVALLVSLGAIALGRAADRGDRQIEAEHRKDEPKYPISPTS